MQGNTQGRKFEYFFALLGLGLGTIPNSAYLSQPEEPDAPYSVEVMNFCILKLRFSNTDF